MEGNDIDMNGMLGGFDMLGAVSSGDISQVEALLDAGKSINDVYLGSTPIGLACSEDDAPMVSFMLGRGADVSKKDANGATALHSAARWGPKCLPLILAAGADLKVVNDPGETAFLVALKEGNVNEAKTLLSLDFEVAKMRPTDGSTPLLCALCCKRKTAGRCRTPV
jgi:ankyrin repeat protein